jgi:FAD/FMN-containing dehydrogenase
MTTTYSQSSASFHDLAVLLTGQLLLPKDAAYEQVRQLWNGKVKTRPAAIARCLSVQDVIHTVHWTRAQGLGLSVRGGGHDFAGRALSENGVAIDLSQMRAVTIDPDARTAHVQGGATIGDLKEQERVPLAFGSNYERLLDLKRTYDPDDVFHSTIGHLALKEKS